MKNKTVLITGGSRGIGKAAAIMFAKHGYDLIINYADNTKAALETKAEIELSGGECLCYKADVSNLSEVSDMADKILKSGKEIDVLINNAGISFGQMLFIDTTEEIRKRIFDVNIHGVFNVTECILPQMINRKAGKIINISSMWGEIGASCEGVYSASKAAVIGFTKSLAKELAPSGITVNCVSPGMIDTDMNSELSKADKELALEEIPLQRIGKTEDIAEAIYFLASESADYITGQVIGVNGGWVI